MKIFSGLSRTDYQDVLRAVGLFLDERGYRNFRLVEDDDGIIIQATPSANGRLSHQYETFFLSEDDLQQIMHGAYRRRGTTGSLGQPSTPGELPTGRQVLRSQRPPSPL
jgi:hypothetical protein